MTSSTAAGAGDPGTSAPAVPGRRGALTRGRAAAAVALAAAATFALASLPWFSAPVTQVSGTEDVVVSGTAASPIIGPLVLVVAAGLVAYLLARGTLARVVAAVLALAGVGVVAACVAALNNPVTPLARLAAEATGVPELAGEVSTTPWGGVATGAAVLLSLAGAGLALAPPATAGPSRYERPSARPHPTPEPPDRTGPARSTGATDTPAARAAQVDDWDALTRGEDPSR